MWIREEPTHLCSPFWRPIFNKSQHGHACHRRPLSFPCISVLLEAWHIITSFYLCWLQTFASSLTSVTRLYNWFPWRRIYRHEETCDDDTGTWSSDNFATINILENITHYMTFQTALRSGRAEIARNHINGYGGSSHKLTMELGFKVSFCFKYSNVNTHHSFSSDGWWGEWCLRYRVSQQMFPCFRPKFQQITVKRFLKSSDW